MVLYVRYLHQRVTLIQMRRLLPSSGPFQDTSVDTRSSFSQKPNWVYFFPGGTAIFSKTVLKKRWGFKKILGVLIKPEMQFQYVCLIWMLFTSNCQHQA